MIEAHGQSAMYFDSSLHQEVKNVVSPSYRLPRFRVRRHIVKLGAGFLVSLS